jgi:AraC-like DNA-binding protein
MPIEDVLGHVLESSQLRGRVFCMSSGRAPWGLRLPARSEAALHLVTMGSAVLLVGAARHALGQGDLVLLPHGTAHVLVDHPRSKPIDLAAWLAAAAPGRMPSLGGHGAETRVLCGVYQLDAPGAQHPVLGLLPPVLHVPATRTRAHPDLDATLAALVREYSRGERGSTVIVARLLDVLLVQVVRVWADDQPAGGAGWIGALGDPVLSRALSAMHGDLSRAWDVAALARAAATSRATLGRRFVAVIGEPPLAYLHGARMYEAARRLHGSDAGLAAIAAAVGYHSEFAFNRAFRRRFGVPPGEFRRRRVHPGTATMQ